MKDGPREEVLMRERMEERVSSGASSSGDRSLCFLLKFLIALRKPLPLPLLSFGDSSSGISMTSSALFLPLPELFCGVLGSLLSLTNEHPRFEVTQ